MDDIGLFDDFGENEENNNDYQLLGKKRQNPNSEIPTENKPHNKISQKEKEKDLLLCKQISQISLNQQEEPSEEDIDIDYKINNSPDIETQITTEKFSGGYHETISPPSKPFTPLSRSTESPALTYPFTLDEFQQRAITCLENNQSVLVSAHTSAGKTAVAEYAIALALKRKQRVIYTSPIKALSNQKYRDLAMQFKDVGLLTGDVTINENSSCLVMTTEILRNMLYKGSSITKEIAWVIFDEVHYMRDKVRGVVWEETIILLSNKINYVFLSATIPNAREFAMWLCKIKEQTINVIYTEFRPVPLRHYVYPSGSTNLYMIFDEKGNYKENNYNKALGELQAEKMAETLENNKEKGKKTDKEKEDIQILVDLIQELSLDPAIIFSFSKDKCLKLADYLSNTELSLIEPVQQEAIEKIYYSAIIQLSDVDQNIPSISHTLKLLKKGIGIHHGGLIPLIRECVELIFQANLLKILFSTETFSMGLNMPAKTVIFNEISKFDGRKNRFLTSGEYIQMSGRAGRRGLDKKGNAITILNDKIKDENIREIVCGKSDRLNSSFSLSFNQILNLCRIEGVKCEYILEKSFRQYQSVRAIPLLKKKILAMYKRYIRYETNYERDELIYDFIRNIEDKIYLEEENRKLVYCSEDSEGNLKKFLVKGRLVEVNKFGVGLVVDYANLETRDVMSYNDESGKYNLVTYKRDKNVLSKDDEDINKKFNKSIKNYSVIKVLVVVDKNAFNRKNNKLINEIEFFDIVKKDKKDGKIMVAPFRVKDLRNISNILINLPEVSENNLEIIYKLIKDLYTSLIEPKTTTINFNYLDPIKDLYISSKQYKENISKLSEITSNLNDLKANLSNYNIHITSSDPSVLNSDFVKLFKEKLSLREQISFHLSELESLNKLVLNQELKNMKSLLKKLKYLDSNEVLTLKGQTACYLTSGNEIILTEMLFNGFLNNLSEKHLIATLSCLINEGSFKKEKEKVDLDSDLVKLYEDIRDIISNVADCYIDSGINIDKENFLKTFKNDLMLVLIFWYTGEKTFGELSENVYGGSLVRCIRRLDEVLKELIECCNLMGNEFLRKKFETIAKGIRKGIPFAASLYLTEEIKN